MRLSHRIFRAEYTGVIVLLVSYVLWFSSQSIRLYNNFSQPPFDLAVFDQGLWLLAHGHTPFVTIMGRNLFGDHTSFILLLIAPFYRFFPEPQGILTLQTMALAAAAIPVFLLSNRWLKNTTLATVMVAAFLLNPMLQLGNLDQFHPDAFVTLFISVAIYAAIERKQALLVVMVALALLTKEDVAALIVPLGVWIALRRDRRLGGIIIAGATGWALVANLLIIPAFLGSSTIYGSFIPFGGIAGFLGTVVHRPGQVMALLTSQNRPFFLWQLGATMGFTFLLWPEMAAIGVGVITEDMISLNPYMHQINYQFTMALVPVLLIGSVYAISRQRKQWIRNASITALIVCATWTCAVWGMAPFSANKLSGGLGSNTAAVDQLIKYLPPAAVVSAEWPIVSRIDHRTNVYVWPVPFSPANWGLPSNPTAGLPATSTIEYLILPVPLTDPQEQNVFGPIASQYLLVKSLGGYGLYHRVSGK